jgi:hypothetical protein
MKVVMFRGTGLESNHESRYPGTEMENCSSKSCFEGEIAHTSLLSVRCVSYFMVSWYFQIINQEALIRIRNFELGNLHKRHKHTDGVFQLIPSEQFINEGYRTVH